MGVPVSAMESQLVELSIGEHLPPTLDPNFVKSGEKLARHLASASDDLAHVLKSPAHRIFYCLDAATVRDYLLPYADTALSGETASLLVYLLGEATKNLPNQVGGGCIPSVKADLAEAIGEHYEAFRSFYARLDITASERSPLERFMSETKALRAQLAELESFHPTSWGSEEALCLQEWKADYPTEPTLADGVFDLVKRLEYLSNNQAQYNPIRGARGTIPHSDSTEIRACAATIHADLAQKMGVSFSFRRLGEILGLAFARQLSTRLPEKVRIRYIVSDPRLRAHLTGSVREMIAHPVAALYFAAAVSLGDTPHDLQAAATQIKTVNKWGGRSETRRGLPKATAALAQYCNTFENKYAAVRSAIVGDSTTRKNFEELGAGCASVSATANYAYCYLDRLYALSHSHARLDSHFIIEELPSDCGFVILEARHADTQPSLARLVADSKSSEETTFSWSTGLSVNQFLIAIQGIIEGFGTYQTGSINPRAHIREVQLDMFDGRTMRLQQGGPLDPRATTLSIARQKQRSQGGFPEFSALRIALNGMLISYVDHSTTTSGLPDKRIEFTCQRTRYTDIVARFHAKSSRLRISEAEAHPMFIQLVTSFEETRS